MINKVVLQGRLTAKPEIKEVGGFNMCEFTVAWSEKYKERETKCFLRCKAWRTTAEFLEKYFDKGQEILVEGSMATETWENDGQTQSRTICNVEKVHFCGKKSDAQTTSGNKSDDGFMNIPDGIEEELPFN